MYIPMWVLLLGGAYFAFRYLRNRPVTDYSGVAEDSKNMVGEIIFIEFFRERPTATADEWLKYFETVNYGRELSNRRFVKIFDTPIKINARIRKALIREMLKFERDPSLRKGENFDARLKELMVLDSAESDS